MSEDVRERRVANCDFFEHEIDAGLGQETGEELRARLERVKRQIQMLSGKKNTKILIVGHQVFFHAIDQQKKPVYYYIYPLKLNLQ